MKKLMVFIFLAFAVSTQAQEPLLKREHVARVTIHSSVTNRPIIFSGSYVWTDGTWAGVLTCAHAVPPKNTIRIMSVHFPSDDGEYTVGYYSVNYNEDLTWLLTAKPKTQPAVIAADAPQVGDPVAWAGYVNNVYTVRAGRVLGYGTTTQQGNWWYHQGGGGRLPEAMFMTGASTSGLSGGPVFSSRGVVSILTSTDGQRSQGPSLPRLRSFVGTLLQLPVKLVNKILER